MALGEGLTDPASEEEPDHYRVLEVHSEATSEVIEAAFSVLREKVIRGDGPDAGRELARLNAAHRALSDPHRRTAYDSLRTGKDDGGRGDLPEIR